MTVIDIGANKGQMALIFAALVGQRGRVLAWEPAPAEFASLTQNLALNNLHQVAPLNVAAADKAGTLRFRYDPSKPTQGKLESLEPSYVLDGEARTFDVEARPLDALLDEGISPDIVKIDAEGAGAAILQGAIRLFDRYSPAVFIELHGPDEQRGVLEHLIRRGYTAFTLNGRVVPDPTAGWFSPLWLTRDTAETIDQRTTHA
jgi:FkbM family methyltransferase